MIELENLDSKMFDDSTNPAAIFIAQNKIATLDSENSVNFVMDENFYILQIDAENLEEALELILQQEIGNIFVIQITYCIEKDVFEIFNELKNLEFKFSSVQKIELQKLVESGEKVLAEIEKLHRAIEQNNLQEIQNFTLNFPNYKFCHKTPDFCALDWSIECKSFEAFSFLRTNGFCTDNGELDEKIKNLQNFEKEKIRDQNLKYMKTADDSFIGILVSKCKFDALSPSNPEDIREMLIKLKNFTDIRPVFELSAESDAKIFFDYTTKSIKSMDPTRSEHVMGIAYYQKDQIYVGRDKSDFERYGTFVHELSHYIFYLIYENDCKPFCVDDEKREKIWRETFTETLEIYQKNRNQTNSIIMFAFQVHKGKKDAELVVRVPNIVATHFKNPQKIYESEKMFEKLFNFHRKFILEDLKIPHVLRLVKMNRDFGMLRKVRDSKLQVRKFEESEKFKNENVIIKKLRKINLADEKILEVKNLTEKNSNEEIINFQASTSFAGPSTSKQKSKIHEISKFPSLKRLNEESSLYLNTKHLKTENPPNFFETPQVLKLLNFDDQRSSSSNLKSPTLSTLKPQKIILTSNVPQLTFSMVLNEINELYENKLHLKVENIFVDQHKFSQVHIQEEFRELLDICKIRRIFLMAESSENLNLSFLKNLKDEIEIFIIFDEEKFKENYLKPQSDKIQQKKLELREKKFNEKISQIRRKNFNKYSKFGESSNFEGESSLEILQNSTIEETVSKKIKLDESCEVQKVENFDQNFIQIESFKFQIITFNHKFQELTEESQNFITQKFVKFQQNSTKLSQLLSNFQEISSDVTKILCSNEVEINCKKFDNDKFFISRIFEKKIQKNFYSDLPKFEEFPLEKFTQIFKSEKVVLIADVAGSGKTTALKNVEKVLFKNFPTFFILFVSLRDFSDEISRGVGENFLDFMLRILLLNPLEKEVFTSKFKNEEVKILFDAFDEISPKCKNEASKFFENFIKCHQKNQIWITTRTHLEHDLETQLQISSSRLKIFNKNDQIQFLLDIWKNSHENFDFIENCAINLVERISTMLQWRRTVIGLPLLVEGLANYFKNEIEETFDEKIKTVKISMVFEKIVLHGSFKILRAKFPEIVDEHLNKTESILKVHQYLAVVYFFDEDFADDLSLSYDTDEWSLEEIARGGIVKYDSNFKIQFNHETYAENLLALVVFKILKNAKKLSKTQKSLIFQVMTKIELEVTRMFLDDMIEKITKVKCEKEILEIFKENENFLHQNAEEGFFELLKFFLDIAKNDEIYGKIIEEIDDYEETVLMKILPKIKNEQKFTNFLDEIFDFYHENVCEKFLNRIDSHDRTIFFTLCDYQVEVEIFKAFWMKIEKNFNAEEIKNFIDHKSNFRNLLCYAVLANNEKLENLFEILVKTFDEATQKDLVDLKDSGIFQISIECDERVFKIFLEFISNLFSDEELLEYFNELDESKSNIFQSFVKYSKNLGTFRLFWLKELEIYKDPKLILGDDKKILKFAMENEICTEMFSHILNLAKGFYDAEKIKELIFFEDDSENQNLLTNAAEFATKSNFKILIQEILKYYDKVKFRNFIINSQNLMTLNLKNNNFDSIEFFWEILEENLDEQEIFQKMKEKNENFDTIFHKISNDDEKIFNFILAKVEKYLKQENSKEILLSKNLSGRNVLTNCDVDFLPQIYEKMFTHLKLKDFIYEIDEEGFNFFHKCAEFPLFETLNFVFKKLQNELSDEDLKIFLRLRTSHGLNFLHLAGIHSVEPDAIKFLIDKTKNIFDTEEIKEILLEVHENVDDDFEKPYVTPLHSAANEGNPDIIQIYRDFYHEIFGEEKTEEILLEYCENEEIKFFEDEDEDYC